MRGLLKFMSINTNMNIDNRLIWESFMETNLFGNRYFHGTPNIGPVYHGGGWNGISAPLIRDGSFGTGIYFTTSKERAMGYATEEREYKSSSKKYLVEAMLAVENPIEMNMENGSDFDSSLDVLMKLTGWNRNKAALTIDRQFERTGNLGNILRKKGIEKGYDSLIIHTKFDIEYVLWFTHSIKVINVEPVN